MEQDQRRMGVVYVLGAVIAVVVGAQLLLLMHRRRPLDKRLRDLGPGGDAFGLLLAGLLTLGATGALTGSLLGSPAHGGAAGLLLALALWITAIIWAHNRPHPPARHR
jgi:hypothetical protein